TPWVMTIRCPAESPGAIHRYAPKSATPISRKWSSGSPRSLRMRMAPLSWRIPDRRRERSLLRRHRHLRIRDLELEVRRVVRGPARRRDLEDARVVDRADRRIEVRVLPDANEFRIADGVGKR